MLTVLAILVLLVLPSVTGIMHDRRIDRQIREAERASAQQTGRRETGEAHSRPRHPAYFTTTVTDHS